MRRPQLPQIDLTEVGLKFTGVALAGGSMAFAAHMMSDPDHQPRITGVSIEERSVRRVHSAVRRRNSARSIARLRSSPVPA